MQIAFDRIFMAEIFKIKIEKNEYWYAGVVSRAADMPFHAESEFSFDLSAYNYENQVAPILLSNQGRCVRYVPAPVRITGGEIQIEYCGATPSLDACGTTLREAYTFACKKYFLPDGKTPPAEFFGSPVFNDWMEIGYDQSQNRILEYADEIADSGYPCSVLMIDDKWTDYYGTFLFSKDRFSDAPQMLKKLHASGMKVMLWESPFITPDSPEMRALAEKNALVREKGGDIAVRKWWNGFSAVLDFSSPVARDWLAEKNAHLLSMGADGFKFDGGDICSYREDDITYGNVNAYGQCMAYSGFALQYKFNELRASADMGGRALVQRACDKAHGWGRGALADIVPGYIVQNLFGYWYASPDMIGGGSIGSDKVVDEELVVRYAECAALMPVMQFSRCPWKMLRAENNKISRSYAKLHVSFGRYIYGLAQHAAKTGEPPARPLEFDYPGQGFEREMGSFMLGDDYLVSPVTEKGMTKKEIRLPLGRWQYVDGKVYDGGRSYVFDAPLNTLPYFKKLV